MTNRGKITLSVILIVSCFEVLRYGTSAWRKKLHIPDYKIVKVEPKEIVQERPEAELLMVRWGNEVQFVVYQPPAITNFLNLTNVGSVVQLGLLENGQVVWKGSK